MRGQRPHAIDQHPKRTAIVRALVRGAPFSELARKYRVSKASLSRFLNRELLERAAAAAAERRRLDGENALETIQWVFDRMRKLYDACDEYLSDPRNPERYTLIPHAEELDVLYATDEPGAKEGRSKAVLHRESLKTMLDRAMKACAGQAIQVKYKHTDPRKLILSTASEIRWQLELVAKIQGKIKSGGEITINILKDPVFLHLQQVILDATRGHPEIRREIARGLTQLSVSAAEDQ